MDALRGSDPESGTSPSSILQLLGGASEYIQNGWYENCFARVDGRWKITRLLHTYQWITGNGALFDFSDPDLLKVMGQVFAAEHRVR